MDEVGAGGSPAPGVPAVAAASDPPLPGTRRLVGDVLIYGAGKLVLQVFPLLALPILTRIFGPDDFTVIETITAVSALLVIVGTLGFDSASQRSFFDYSEEQVAERHAMLSTALWTVTAASAVMTLPLAFLAPVLSDWLFGDDRYATALVLGLATVPLTIVSNLFLEIMRLRHQPWMYTLVSTIAAVTTIGLVLWFVAGPRWGLDGFYLGFLIGTVAPLLVGLWIVRTAIVPRFDRRELRIMAAYGLPLVWMGAFTWVTQLINRFFLLEFAPFEEAGLFGVGARVSNVLLLAIIAFGVAWSPFILELHAKDPERARELRGRLLTGVTLLLCIVAALISVVSHEFFLIVTGDEFERAYQVVGLLAAGNVALGINGITGTGISLARATRWFAIYGAVAAVITVVLNLALIPPMGMVGAALASLLTYAVLAVLYWRREATVDPAPYEGRRLAAIVALSAAVGTAGTLILIEPLWLGVAVKLVAVAALAVTCWRIAGLPANPKALLAPEPPRP